MPEVDPFPRDRQNETAGREHHSPVRFAGLVDQECACGLRELLLREVELDMSSLGFEKLLFPNAELISQEEVDRRSRVLILPRFRGQGDVAATKSLPDLLRC